MISVNQGGCVTVPHFFIKYNIQHLVIQAKCQTASPHGDLPTGFLTPSTEQLVCSKGETRCEQSDKARVQFITHWLSRSLSELFVFSAARCMSGTCICRLNPGRIIQCFVVGSEAAGQEKKEPITWFNSGRLRRNPERGGGGGGRGEIP